MSSLRGLTQAVQIGLDSVEEVAGQESHIGAQTGCQTHHAARECHAIHIAKVKIGEQNRPSPAPGRGQVGQPDGDAANANPAGVDEAVDAGQNGDAGEGAAICHPRLGGAHAG